MTAPASATTRSRRSAALQGDAAGCRARPTAIRLAALVVALAGWEAGARHAANVFFPPPSALATWIRGRWLTGPAQHLYLDHEVLHHTGASLGRMLTGWAIAGLLGAALGLLLGRFRLAHDLTDPIVQFGRSVPPVTLIPLFFVLFAAGPTTQVALIVTGVIWPVLLNTITGIRAIDPALLETIRVLGIGRAHRVIGVLLPAAAPSILVGLRISLSLALILMVVSELYAATDGIGYALLAAQQAFDAPAMWAWIVLLAVAGNTGNAALGGITRIVLARHGHLTPHTGER